MKHRRPAVRRTHPSYNTIGNPEPILPDPPKPIKISSFICMTNAVRRGDTFIEAIQSHLLFSDEVVIVDGGSTDGTIERITAFKRIAGLSDEVLRIVTLPWPEDWSWEEFPKHWNFGYQNCTGDWVAAGETDHIWHGDTASLIRKTLEHSDYANAPVVGVPKIQTSIIDRTFNKWQFPYFVNKKMFGDKIGYGLDRDNFSDLTHPLFIQRQTGDLMYEGSLIKDFRTVRLPFINYVWVYKTYDMIVEERFKGLQGWKKFAPFWDVFKATYPGGRSEADIQKDLKPNMIWRYDKCTISYPLPQHPAHMQLALVTRLKPGMYGYDLCGQVDPVVLS